MFPSIWSLPRRTYRQVKWAWQRVFRGWDDSMVFDSQAWLSETLPPMILELKKYKGYPGTFITDDVKDLPQDEQDEICVIKWHGVLDQIVDGFTAAQQISDEAEPIWDEYFAEVDRVCGDRWTAMFEDNCKIRNEIWERLNVAERLKVEEAAFRKRYNIGMDLFKEYYFNLWW